MIKFISKGKWFDKGTEAKLEDYLYTSDDGKLLGDFLGYKDSKIDEEVCCFDEFDIILEHEIIYPYYQFIGYRNWREEDKKIPIVMLIDIEDAFDSKLYEAHVIVWKKDSIEDVKKAILNRDLFIDPVVLITENNVTRKLKNNEFYTYNVDKHILEMK